MKNDYISKDALWKKAIQKYDSGLSLDELDELLESIPAADVVEREKGTMYDKLIEDLRRHHCDAKEDDTQEVCEECAYNVIIADKNALSGIASVCVCGLMHRAADAIEELRKAVLRLEDESCIYDELPTYYIYPTKWIPVTERLPTMYEWVLVTNGEFITIDKLRGTVTYNAITGEQEKLTIDWYKNPFYPDNVTHWMKLPEPPKDGET